MESMILLYLVTGALLGGGAVWLQQQRRLRHARQQIEAADEATRQTIKNYGAEQQRLNDELNSQQQEIERREQEITTLRERITSLTATLEGSHQDFRALSRHLEENQLQLKQITAENDKIPELENKLHQQETETARLRQQVTAAEQQRRALEEELATAHGELEECLIYVEGSHYLPGRVVRDLLAAAQQRPA